MISGIILAGGAGTRMKGRDKGLEVWHGKALIDHVIEGFLPQVTTLHINANRNHSCYQRRGYPVIEDRSKQLLGPLAGIAVGLEVIQSPWLAVAPCDSPIFPHNYVQRLYHFAQEKQLSLTWVSQNGRDHPLFCLINGKLREALNDFLYSQERRRVLDFFNDHGTALMFSEKLPSFANFNDESSLK
ncbi:molybdenum cofactor guanylyltransferase [Rosenbergiella australiborealis]|uniref:Molybdenum cofactor guanylyltransferase n=1 Tax=Rosenbergiella australiborealis TaxID=1544696 RepID=A0ABS5T847_9GAMM|nr:molybdenum cofactor guanylyltransferase MobA [Rosenbergiella australiborealis]MBT0728496.1 molybdenum cofactor guanylyltransferase [Rosenbergiella australiborealis]